MYLNKKQRKNTFLLLFIVIVNNVNAWAGGGERGGARGRAGSRGREGSSGRRPPFFNIGAGTVSHRHSSSSSTLTPLLTFSIFLAIFPVLHNKWPFQVSSLIFVCFQVRGNIQFNGLYFSTECPCYSYMQNYNTFHPWEILFLIRIAFACTFFFLYMYLTFQTSRNWSIPALWV